MFGKFVFRKEVTGIFQHTIRHPIAVSGLSLHGGQPVTVQLLPAEPDHGIVFQVVSGAQEALIPAHIQYLADSERSTALAHHGVVLSTVEHCLAACWGAKVDNLLIKVWGNELPGFDGSCRIWQEILREADSRPLPKPRTEIEVTEPVTVSHNGSVLSVFPASEFGVRFLLDYAPNSSRMQWVSFTEGNGWFDRLAQARTFAFRWEINQILRLNLGRGVRDQAILLGEAGDDPAGLRMPGEASYHKIIDIIGDAMLAGRRIRGEFVGIRSGHTLNHRLISLLADPGK